MKTLVLLFILFTVNSCGSNLASSERKVDIPTPKPGEMYLVFEQDVDNKNIEHLVVYTVEIVIGDSIVVDTRNGVDTLNTENGIDTIPLNTFINMIKRVSSGASGSPY